LVLIVEIDWATCLSMLLVEWNYYPTRLIPVVEIKLFHFSDFAVHGSGGLRVRRPLARCSSARKECSTDSICRAKISSEAESKLNRAIVMHRQGDAKKGLVADTPELTKPFCLRSCCFRNPFSSERVP
jgi:hypothetical protein